jgi:hypothetical protein
MDSTQIRRNYFSTDYKNQYLPCVEFFFIGIGFYALLYIFFDKLLSKISVKYAQLEPQRKLYVLKNITKFIGLTILLKFAFDLFWVKYFEGIWINNLIYSCGFFYCSADFLGLILISTLPINSKIHHISTVLISILVSQIDFEKENSIMESIIIFTFLSAKSGIVNLYLGIRFLSTPHQHKIILWSAYYIYVYTFTINLIIQYYALWRYAQLSLFYLTHFILCNFVIYDDIELIKFLKHQKSKYNIPLKKNN